MKLAGTIMSMMLAIMNYGDGEFSIWYKWFKISVKIFASSGSVYGEAEIYDTIDEKPVWHEKCSVGNTKRVGNYLFYIPGNIEEFAATIKFAAETKSAASEAIKNR